MLWEEGKTMIKSFLGNDRSILCTVLQYREKEQAIGVIRNALAQGTEAFLLQIESLADEHKNIETFRNIIVEMHGKPCYVTNYRTGTNTGKSDETLAEEMLLYAENGATLCDVMGDMFCEHPEQMTDNPGAIDKQIRYIEELHKRGAEVLMSSHLFKFTPAERVLEIALEQKRRGADIIKIVVAAKTMDEQIENIRITNLLKEELGAPFLFLSNGESSVHRRLGMKLGCCMCLCVYEHHMLSTPAQPLLSVVKTIRNDIGF